MQDEVSITGDGPGTLLIAIYDSRSQLVVECGDAKAVYSRGKAFRIRSHLVASLVDHVYIRQAIRYSIEKFHIPNRIHGIDNTLRHTLVALCTSTVVSLCHGPLNSCRAASGPGRAEGSQGLGK